MTADEARSRRRALAKQHHPDRGGDPEAFDRAMRAEPGTASRGPAAVGSDSRRSSGESHDIVFTPSARTRLRRGVAATRQSARSAVRTQVVRWVELTRRAP